MFHTRAALPLIILIIAAAPLSAHPSNTKAKTAHTASHANAQLVQWLKKQYAYQDGGWQKNDVARVMSRTTADYQYKTVSGEVNNRDQMAQAYAGMMTALINKQADVTQTSSVNSVAISSNQAIVRVTVKIRGTRHIDLTEGDSATMNARASNLEKRETWVHLVGGWYLARSEELNNKYTVETDTHLNE